jgi:hypothetical protein
VEHDDGRVDAGRVGRVQRSRQHGPVAHRERHVLFAERGRSPGADQREQRHAENHDSPPTHV